MTVIGTILIVLGSIGVGLLIDRKWSVLPRKKQLHDAAKRGLKAPEYAPGESPSTAIEARPSEIEKLRRKKCCSKEVDVLADDRVLYDGVELLVLHNRCRECGKTRSTYVRGVGY